MSNRLLLGTRNPGKIYEIKLILGDLPLEFFSLNDFPHVAIPVEDADTYAGNAIKKARFYARETGAVALADDSGLEVEALDGAPGVISHRYAGDDADDAGRRKFLLSKLAEAGSDNRRARFVCAVAIATADGEVVNLCEGICEGVITFEERGESGFGYDPLFVPDGYDQTFGELSDDVKNRISHRARALIKLRDVLGHESRGRSA
jgi:XTP/dITP diphosphohydrolase